MKLGIVNKIICTDVPSNNSQINSGMVEAPISNPYPQVHHHSDHNQGSSMRSHIRNKLITDKKSVMELSLDQCDVATRAEITLGRSHEDDVMTGGLLKFLTRVRKVCPDSEDKDVRFGSSINRITKHHI